MLELRGVVKRFGGVVAVNHLTMSIGAGEIRGLIGPNGSGKSTVFNLICGVLAPNAGAIVFRGRDITGRSPHHVAAVGVSRTFQATTLFSEMTVEENLHLSSHLRAVGGLWGNLLWSPRYRAGERAARRWTAELLHDLRLAHIAHRVVRDLPHRDQKAVVLGNLLATGAELLLLDEPFAGLTAQETNEFMELIRQWRHRGKSILLVEHNIRSVMGLCDGITVLNHGAKIAEGTAAEIKQNAQVIEAYLGESPAHA
jgi:branched-chain amino acid transport system ATP-binding protein